MYQSNVESGNTASSRQPLCLKFAGSLLAWSLLASSAVATKNLPIEHVTTTAKRIESDALTHIGSISAVDEESLQLVAPVHIQEALLRVPGVNLNRGEGQEYLPAIRSPVLTGAGACGGFLTAEDGIPLRAAGFCNINELFEAHTEVASRIEVLRGPGTALYGSNALHGVVNVITTDAGGGSLLGVEVGPYDYARTRLLLSQGQSKRGFALNFSATHDGGYREASGFDQQKVTLRHSYPGDTWEVTSGLTATNLEQETAGYIVGEGAYRDRDLVRENPNPEAYRDARSLRLWSKWGRADDDGGRWLITPYLRHTDMDFLMHFVPGTPLEENGQVSVGLQLTRAKALSASIDIIAGVDAEYTRGFLKETQAQPALGSAFLQATIPQGKHYDYDVDAAVLAPFMQLDWAFAKRWQLSAGVRYEWLEYDYTNNMLTGRSDAGGTACGFGGCRFSRPPNGRDSFANWSPKLGLSVELNDSQMLYLSAARGFRAPQATELYRLQREQTVTDLDSEQVDSIELGWKGDRKSLRYELVAYSMNKKNYIYRDIDFFNVSDGETDHRGVELNATGDLGSDWDLGVSFSYADHSYAYDEFQDGENINGNQVDTAPRVFGSARLGWRWAEHSRLELEWLHMGKFYLEPGNNHRYPGHDLLNLRASWQMQSGLTLYGRLLNLTDRTYAERADYTGFTGQRYFPGRPRTLYVGVEWRWD